MANYDLDGEGETATAAAGEENWTPRMRMFTDGCAKQYKEPRSSRFLSDRARWWRLKALMALNQSMYHFAAADTNQRCDAFAQTGPLGAENCKRRMQEKDWRGAGNVGRRGD